jgi:hypothetical protein
MIPAGSAILATAITIAGVITHGNEPPSMGLLLMIGAVVILCIGSSILLLVWMLLPSVPGNNAYVPNRYAGA